MQNASQSQPDGVIVGAITPELRACAKCGELKPTSEFGKFHRGPGGLNHKCKVCCKLQGKEWRAANREQELERGRAWRAANPETRKRVVNAYTAANKPKIAAQAKEYRDSNPEKMRARGQAYYAGNREKCLEANKAWADRNPDKVRAKGRAWGQRNPDKINAKCSRRRAKTSAVRWADKRAIAKLYRDAKKITASSGVPHEVDHIYPLNGKTVIGLHVEANLQIIKQSVNRRKKNKLPGNLPDELWDLQSKWVYHEQEAQNG